MKPWMIAICGMLLAGNAPAALKTEVVKYKVGDVECQGFLAYDDQGGKRPGILVAPEWWGLTDYAKHRAEQLAGLGYVAFAMDPYGDGQTTDDPKEAGKLAGGLKKDLPTLCERAKAALELLSKQDMVDPDKLVAIGYCFGGTTVLELARSGADLKGVVSFHGGLATPNRRMRRTLKAAC